MGLTEKGKRDLKLINRALETGDTRAYNELMRLYRDPLYFMLFEKVGNEEIAKDLSYLTSQWNKIREKTLKSDAPSLIFEEDSFLIC